MDFHQRRPIGRLGVIVTSAVVLTLAACSSSGAKHGDNTTVSTNRAGVPTKTGPIGSSNDSGSPADGGVLRVIYEDSDPSALDPILNSGGGPYGLGEMTAIYGALMRYDPATNKYIPDMAQSVTNNADYTQYTVKLRPGVKFTDGTPFNSEAVKSGYERFTGPDSRQIYAGIFPEILGMDTPDPLTVVIKLKASDPSFPYLMTQSFGQVPSPTAVKKQGATQFNLHPVGAGPFMVKSYTPNVKLSLVRNPNYWGPAPHLDGIDFTWVAGDKARVEALQGGNVDLINTRDPIQAKQAIRNGASGFGWLTYGSPVMLMNNRKGKLFADKRLRQAVAYALDPKVINSRVFQGNAISSTDLFPAGLLKSDAKGLPLDLGKARELVSEVKKSTGWNGSFTLLTPSSSPFHDVALNVQAMLNNVGFRVVVSPASAPTVSSAVYAHFNFTAVINQVGFVETDPYVYLQYETSGKFSPTGWVDPRIDNALTQIREAKNESELKAAASAIQAIWNDDVPEVWLGAQVQSSFWSSKVHGIVPTASNVVLYDKAWLSH